MLIGIDASRATMRQRTGTEGYSLHLLNALIELAPQHQFRLYVREMPTPDLFPSREGVEIRLIQRRRLWTHLGLGPEVRRNRPDVLFVPAHVLPWPDLGGVPSVVTLHDLGYRYYPEKHGFFERLYLNWSTRHSAEVANRVIAHSQATAHDLSVLDQVPPEKIRVIYSGVDPMMQPPDTAVLARVRGSLGLDGPYLLHVGRIEARKNLVRLVEAFALLRADFPDLSLVLAGKPGRPFPALASRIEALSLGDSLRLPGYVAEQDLPALYHGAEVYVFPSLYEGFGFPALEAMACGTAVVCANSSSLPELVGDAALRVPPADVQALAEAIRRILTESGLRDTLIARGFENVGRFSWEACARATLAVLEEAAQISGRTFDELTMS